MLDLLLSLLLQLALLTGTPTDQKDKKNSTTTASTYSTTTTTEEAGGTTTTNPAAGNGSGETSYGGSGTWETKN